MVAQAVNPKPATPPKAKKEPQKPAQRVTEMLRRAAMQGNISASEIENISNLCGALKTFIAS